MKRHCWVLFLLAVVASSPSFGLPDAPPALCPATETTQELQVAALAEGALLLSAVPQDRISCGPYCDGFYSTVTTFATGSSCSIAQSNLTTLLRSVAKTTTCGGIPPCAVTVIYTVPCRLVSPGVYQVDGYANHGCRDSTC